MRDVGAVIPASVNDGSGYYTATEIEFAMRHSDLGGATLQDWLQDRNGAREHILALNNGFNCALPTTMPDLHLRRAKRPREAFLPLPEYLTTHHTKERNDAPVVVQTERPRWL